MQYDYAEYETQSRKMPVCLPVFLDEAIDLANRWTKEFNKEANLEKASLIMSCHKKHPIGH